MQEQLSPIHYYLNEFIHVLKQEQTLLSSRFLSQVRMAQLSSTFLGSKLSFRVAQVTPKISQAPRQVTTMAKKKGVRCIITLECTEARKEGGTPSRYTTQKVRLIANGSDYHRMQTEVRMWIADRIPAQIGVFIGDQA